MFEKWKAKREAAKARSKAVAESQYWKNHALLRTCLQQMRGSCTVAPMELHEAAVAAVNIALQEDAWQQLAELSDILQDLMPDTVYLVWDDEKLPVLKAPWVLAEQNLPDVRAVAGQTFLVSEELDRILWFDGSGQIKLYSIA